MNKIIILGHENPDVDSIVSGYLLEKVLNSKSIECEFIIPDKELLKESIDICLKFGLDPRKFQKELTNLECDYILVDHNNRKVNGNVIAIIDHHPNIEGIQIEKNNYNFFRSSTSCIIAQKYYEFLNTDDLKLAIVASMCDTASFNSTKSNFDDLKWIKKVCNEKSIDYKELYNVGLCLTELNDIKITSLNGLKKYNINNKKIYSSYIQIKNVKENDQYIKDVIEYLKEYLIKNGIDYFVFIVHNMSEFKTIVYCISKDKIEIINYDKYTSRGNNIIPDITRKLDKHLK